MTLFGRKSMHTLRSPTQTAKFAAVMSHSIPSTSYKYLALTPLSQRRDRTAVVGLYGALDWADQ